MKNSIKNQINESIEVKKKILEDECLIDNIEDAARIIIESYKTGGKTLIAGNGGSAGDAQHIAGEFVGKFYFDRPGLSSISLTTNASVTTAIGNDFGFGRIFARQVEAYGREGDVFIGISTSGNSEDILEALRYCKNAGIKSIGLTGKTGGLMSDLCDICLKVPSTETPRIQESHILIGHILCCLTEEILFKGQKAK